MTRHTSHGMKAYAHGHAVDYRHDGYDRPADNRLQPSPVQKDNGRAECPVCGLDVPLRANGHIVSHRVGRSRADSWPCPGGADPIPECPPWCLLPATHDGAHVAPAAREVACPRCEAKPGQPCWSLTHVYDWAMEGYHRERLANRFQPTSD